MSDADHIGKLLIDGVAAIDQRCNKIVDGVECGLVYVKEQFANDALPDGQKVDRRIADFLVATRLFACGGHES